MGALMSFLVSMWSMLWDVLCFWRHKTAFYLFNPSPQERWSQTLREATTYGEWAEAARQLDLLFGLDMWRHNPMSRDYDYRLINDRVRLIKEARQQGDIYRLFNLLRACMLRNLGNITSSKLFNCSFSGTKHLIDEYVQQYVAAIREIAALPAPSQYRGPPPVDTVVSEYEDGEVNPAGGNEGAGDTGRGPGAEEGAGEGEEGGPDEPAASPSTSPQYGAEFHSGMAAAAIPPQYKLDFLHDVRLGFGRTALVLQGGAIFGLCHLGVVKALLEQDLLPRVIIGTATGAMMAALVGVHPKEDLLRILQGDGIDLSAFARSAKGSVSPDTHNRRVMESMWTQWDTLTRRVRRFRKEGYFLDVKVLEECVRANIGDLTFEEAFNRSKRILNITVVPAGQDGIPTLLNYVTAPNVLVWTAAVASNASSSAFYGHRQTKILCKDAHGEIKPWAPTDTVDFRHWTLASSQSKDAAGPLARVAGLFNVNHYVISQARPYLVPFTQPDLYEPSFFGRYNRLSRARAFVMHMIGLETRHWLRMLDQLRLLPPSIRRFLVDETLPGPSLTLVPQVGWRDFVRLLETPTPATLEFWIRRGERSVWPAVAALRARLAIEMELDHAYQEVRRIKAGGLRRKGSHVETTGARAGTQHQQARRQDHQEHVHYGPQTP
ncbi:hypothetical protein VTJ83DRAFT_506 [Remersonia thermophila]|uniref:PNPLA domain-containing protein n=1 Tax=Remersonia thermophila TaxID=72144 RepID=A0ABR4DL87_9PEZI